MIDVCIRFKVPKEVYDQYEGILQEFINYLSDLRIVDVEVEEY